MFPFEKEAETNFIKSFSIVSFTGISTLKTKKQKTRPDYEKQKPKLYKAMRSTESHPKGKNRKVDFGRETWHEWLVLLEVFYKSRD